MHPKNENKCNEKNEQLKNLEELLEIKTTESLKNSKERLEEKIEKTFLKPFEQTDEKRKTRVYEIGK